MIDSNKEIFKTAIKQSAIDANCREEDFFSENNVIVKSGCNGGARKYLELPFDCNLIYYVNNIVASVNEKYMDTVQKYLDRFSCVHCFETPNLHALDGELNKYGLQSCFMAEYFLPDIDRLRALECGYRLKLLGPEDFQSLYLPQWSNALCEKRKQLDVLGIGAYNEDGLIGLAACSADCETMWQIGVDVLPQYRRQGLAAALTSNLAIEILKRDKVPFYCAAWSNIGSVRNAIKCGFMPAWVELTFKSIEFINKTNGAP